MITPTGVPASVASTPPGPETMPATGERLGAGAVVGRVLAIGAGSTLLATLLGAIAAFATYAIFAADGDPGDWDQLGSLLMAVGAFVVVGAIGYIIGIVQGIRRYIPNDQKLLAVGLLLAPVALPVCLYGLGLFV